MSSRPSVTYMLNIFKRLALFLTGMALYSLLGLLIGSINTHNFLQLTSLAMLTMLFMGWVAIKLKLSKSTPEAALLLNTFNAVSIVLIFMQAFATRLSLVTAVTIVSSEVLNIPATLTFLIGPIITAFIGCELAKRKTIQNRRLKYAQKN